MAKKDYKVIEGHIGECFKVGESFIKDNLKHEIIKSEKPKTPGIIGECKTDLYLQTVSEKKNTHEFKISIKLENYEFIENKITLERAKQIFGDDASNIIFNATQSIKNFFRGRKVNKS